MYLVMGTNYHRYTWIHKGSVGVCVQDVQQCSMPWLLGRCCAGEECRGWDDFWVDVARLLG